MKLIAYVAEFSYLQIMIINHYCSIAKWHQNRRNYIQLHSTFEDVESLLQQLRRYR